jgi:hypothetical protein
MASQQEKLSKLMNFMRVEESKLLCRHKKGAFQLPYCLFIFFSFRQIKSVNGIKT